MVCYCFGEGFRRFFCSVFWSNGLGCCSCGVGLEVSLLVCFLFFNCIFG